AADFSFQRFSLLWFDERRKLNEPGGSAFRQVLKNRTLVSIANQLSERLEHWVVSFLAAKTFHALSACYPYVFAPGRPVMKKINESSFTDAGFAGYENHLPLSRECFRETDLEFGNSCFAAHHVCFGSSDAGRRSRHTCLTTYLRHKAISASR